MQKILFQRDWALGDVLMLTALSKHFKEQNFYIGYQTKIPEILYNNSFIDEVNPARGHFERVIDFNGVVETFNNDYFNIPRVALFFKKAQVDTPNFPQLSYFPSEKELTKANKTWHTSRKRLIYSIQSNAFSRTYPIRQSFKLLEALVDHFVVMIVGSYSYGKDHVFYKEYSEWLNDSVIDQVGKTNVRELAALVATSDLVISPDSGILHLANAVKKPCIGLFGNIPPHLRTFYYDNTRVIFSNPSCLCYNTHLIKKCPNWQEVATGRTFGPKCMADIQPNDILTVVAETSDIMSQNDPKYYFYKYLNGNGVIFDKTIPAEYYYDYILCNDNIPKEVIKNLIKSLNNGGYLCVRGKNQRLGEGEVCARYYVLELMKLGMEIIEEKNVVDYSHFIVVSRKPERKRFVLL